MVVNLNLTMASLLSPWPRRYRQFPRLVAQLQAVTHFTGSIYDNSEAGPNTRSLLINRQHSKGSSESEEKINYPTSHKTTYQHHCVSLLASAS